MIMYNPLLQEASNALFNAIGYASMALVLWSAGEMQCADAIHHITKTDTLQLMDLLKSCAASTSVDPDKYARLIDVHPFSYFSTTSEVYQSICQAHFSCPANNPDALNFPKDVFQYKVKREVTQPYMVACCNHHWITPAVYVSCAISVAYVGYATYLAVRVFVG